MLSEKLHSTVALWEWSSRDSIDSTPKFTRLTNLYFLRAEKTGGGGSEALTELASQQFASAMVTADGTTFDIKDYQSKKEVGCYKTSHLYCDLL